MTQVKLIVLEGNAGVSLGFLQPLLKKQCYWNQMCSVQIILKMHRLMYLHHILRRPKEELITKFYEAQKCQISKGDWVQSVKENLQELEIDFEEVKISQMSKYRDTAIFKI